MTLRLKPPALGTSPFDLVGVGVESAATDDDAATGAIDESDPARDVCARFCRGWRKTSFLQSSFAFQFIKVGITLHRR